MDLNNRKFSKLVFQPTCILIKCERKKKYLLIPLIDSVKYLILFFLLISWKLYKAYLLTKKPCFIFQFLCKDYVFLIYLSRICFKIFGSSNKHRFIESSILCICVYSHVCVCTRVLHIRYCSNSFCSSLLNK